MSLLNVWLWGMLVFAVIVVLVWLIAAKPVRWRTANWAALAVVFWPAIVTVAIIALVLMLLELIREARSDPFWRLG